MFINKDNFVAQRQNYIIQQRYKIYTYCLLYTIRLILRSSKKIHIYKSNSDSNRNRSEKKRYNISLLFTIQQSSHIRNGRFVVSGGFAYKFRINGFIPGTNAFILI